mmetsp:Transcript_22091/g.28582  ORF Transcript_22091/g.28582 Transcript_22091/m.28582 type:complete len:144 (+) Transcript_22091:589-1020(+)
MAVAKKNEDVIICAKACLLFCREEGEVLSIGTIECFLVGLVIWRAVLGGCCWGCCCGMPKMILECWTADVDVVVDKVFVNASTTVEVVTTARSNKIKAILFGEELADIIIMVLSSFGSLLLLLVLVLLDKNNNFVETNIYKIE